MVYNTILFDLDGTLTDSGEGIVNSVAYALDKMRIAVSDRSQLTAFVGPPLQYSFAHFYQLTGDDCTQAVSFFREYFTTKGMFENTVYSGIPQLLEQLKSEGKHLLVATSKPEKFARQILEHFQLDGYFDYIAGASLDNSRLSKAAVITRALKKTGLSASDELVMIGDREHDVIGAKENKLAAIGVLYGYGSQEELKEAGASAVVQSVSELHQLLTNEKKR